MRNFLYDKLVKTFGISSTDLMSRTLRTFQKNSTETRNSEGINGDSGDKCAFYFESWNDRSYYIF